MKTPTPTDLRRVLDALELMLTHDLTPSVRSHVEHLRNVYLVRWSVGVLDAAPPKPKRR